MAKRKVKQKSKVNLLDKQAMLVFGAIAIFLVGLIATPYIYHQLFEKFNYAGINFEKTRFEKITFYKGVYPIIYQGKFIHDYNVYLRTDPRKNQIPINTNIGISSNVTVSLEPEATFCQSAILGQSLIGQFLSAFPWVKNVDVASNNAEIAKAQNWSYATCNVSNQDHTVFIIQKSEAPSIEKSERDNCFIVNVGECQNIETVERLVVGTLAQISGVKI
jgi:hypothetical protein